MTQFQGIACGFCGRKFFDLYALRKHRNKCRKNPRRK